MWITLSCVFDVYPVGNLHVRGSLHVAAIRSLDITFSLDHIWMHANFHLGTALILLSLFFLHKS